MALTLVEILLFGLSATERDRLGIWPLDETQLRVVCDIVSERGIGVAEAATLMYGPRPQAEA